MSTPVQRFNESDPLPRPGLLVLEASAGTGKTYTIAQLVRRFIAEDDVEIGSILAMTFGRSATQELRDRIRRELQRFIREEGSPRPDGAQAPIDQGDRSQQIDRAKRALATFDSAAIMTIHEFCTDAFSRFGVRADADPGVAVSEDLSELVLETCDDAYLGLFANAAPLAAPGPDGRVRTSDLSPMAARAIGRGLAAHPDAELILAPVHPAEPEQQRIDFALAVRQGIKQGKHRDNVASYDDLVLRLRDALADPMAREGLRKRFRVVLVDEFQDTDPVQWTIVEQAFLPDKGALGGEDVPVVVLIGDPKQGIYSFRGADIHSYTKARDTPGAEQRTLGVNHRSDGPVVAGILDLLGDLEVGDGIEVRQVDTRYPKARLNGPGVDPQGRRVRLRVCQAPKGTASDPLRAFVADDVAKEISRTLLARPVICLEDGDGQPLPPRVIVAGDFAVIVRTNDQAALIHAALRRAGIPAVINSQVSVFTSPAAAAWLALLRAMERPTRDRLRVAALGEFIAADPASLVADPEGAMSQVADLIADLARVFRLDGIPAVLAVAMHPAQAAGPGMYERILGRTGGERYLTDIRHVASLLHEEHRRTGVALTGLADWLAMQIEQADSDTPERAETLTRRLDSDADAVQVVTIHRCKGLQYSIAYIPFGSVGSQHGGSPVVCTTDLGTDPPRMRRVIDVRSYLSGSKVEAKKSDTDRLKEIRKEQSLAEDLRMLYVALTRGIHEVVITWSMSEGANANGSPLHRALSAKTGVPDATYPSDPPLDKARDSEHVAVDVVPYVDVATAPAAAAASPATLAARAPDLVAAPYDRTDIDTAWARASFTGLTKGEHRTPMEPADEATGEKDDEPTNVPADEPSDGWPAEPLPSGRTAPDPRLATRSPMADLPAGTAFGTLVHAVLEHTDPAASDLDSEVRQRCDEVLTIRPMRDLTAEQLATAIAPVLRTPLGHLAPGTALADIAQSDRLPELDFELPLHQDRGAAQTVASIGALLASAADEPAWVRDYGRRLQRAPFSWKQLRGYLTGSIDAVLRIDGRCYVVDYKTNRLGEMLGDYHPEALTAAMTEANYPLQALLYSVALHRFLRLRMPGYDATQHLGGILYLFVRGMAGPGTPVGGAGDPCGVFGWRPTASLVQDLSNVLGGEPA